MRSQVGCYKSQTLLAIALHFSTLSGAFLEISEMPRLYRFNQILEILPLSAASLRRMISAGEFPAGHMLRGGVRASVDS